jgi:hypothetical protein
MNLVNKLDETVIIGDQRFELSTNNYGDTIAYAVNSGGFSLMRRCCSL